MFWLFSLAVVLLGGSYQLGATSALVHLLTLALVVAVAAVAFLLYGIVRSRHR